MARYFFDWTENGIYHADETGVDLPDMTAVKLDSARALVERGRWLFPTGDRHRLEIVVRDDAGRQVMRTRLILETHSGADGG